MRAGVGDLWVHRNLRKMESNGVRSLIRKCRWVQQSSRLGAP